MKYVSVKEMQTIERQADASGLSYAQMMENAGKGLGEIVDNACRHYINKKVIGLIGSGNNGGDTLVALAYLAQRGWETTAYIVKARPPDDELVNRLTNEGGKIIHGNNDTEYQQLHHALDRNSVLLDGILGTGFRLPLKGDIAAILDFTNRYITHHGKEITVIAVDCPSGVDCDSGATAPQTLKADITVTMAAIKAGLLKTPAFQFAGDIQVVDIGLPENLPVWKQVKRVVPDIEYVKSVIPKRDLEAHKGTFGTALIIAGSQNYTGAALLAGKAAYISGAGLVTLAIPAVLHSSISGQFPEATWLLLPDDAGSIAEAGAVKLLENQQKVTAMLVGPGFGLQRATEKFFSNWLQGISQQNRKTPLVIDADGLKLLARNEGWAMMLPKLTILTPHPGEMAVLTGLTVDEIQSDRLNIAEKYAQEWGHIIVLKGAFTVVASPDGTSGIVPIATPALARAGSGDVLGGIICGLRAQGMEAFDAALTGAWIHGKAGLAAADAMGSTAAVLAGDILMGCVNVMADIEMN